MYNYKRTGEPNFELHLFLKPQCSSNKEIDPRIYNFFKNIMAYTKELNLPQVVLRGNLNCFCTCLGRKPS